MRRKLKEYFFAGLVVIIPLYLTIAVINFIIEMTDKFLAIIPLTWRTSAALNLPGYGLIFALALTFLAGVIVKNIFGHSLLDAFDHVVARIPVVASIYKLFKQISESLLSQEKGGFKDVVLVEWPRTGAWTIAFVASKTDPTLVKVVPNSDAEGLLNLFIPTTPNPTSGFYFMVPRKSVIPLKMSVEDAFKTIVSCGTIAGKNETPTHS